MIKHKLLSVDDREDCQTLIKSCLDNDLYQIDEAYSVEEALTASNQLGPELILMDVNLPDGSGYDVCRSIVGQSNQQDTDIIFISALNSLEDRLEAYRCGASDYLAKPINPEELQTKVRRALENQQKKKQLAEQVQEATSTALTAMTNSGEQGSLLAFSTETFNCQSLEQLANATFSLLQQFSLQGSLRLEALPETQYFSSQGVIAPLAKQLLDNASHSQKIISKGNRSLFNDQQTTILISNMPIENEAFYGRLKDHVALICKIINARIVTLNLEHQAQNRRLASAGDALDLIKGEMNSLDENVLQIEAKLRHLVDDLLIFYEEELLALGLTEEQEKRLLLPLAQTKDQIGDLFDITEAVESNMQTIEQAILKMVNES